MRAGNRLIPNSGKLRALFLGAIIVTASLVLGASPAAAQDVDEPAVIVDIQETGTVDLTVVFTYDLETATDREAFESLKDDESLKSAMETRFTDRMRAVANASATETGRDIAVTGVDITVDSTDSTGNVLLTATITELATVTNGQITLSQPFDSGFQTDRPLIVTVPDGHEVTSVAPEPDEKGESEFRWAPDRTLDGFEVVATESVGENGTATSTPGMGILAFLVAATVVALIGLRRP